MNEQTFTRADIAAILNKIQRRELTDNSRNWDTWFSVDEDEFGELARCEDIAKSFGIEFDNWKKEGFRLVGE